MELESFAQLEPSGKFRLIEKGPNPPSDGYELLTLDGLPYHAHPDATPELWSAVQSAIAAQRVVFTSWQPPAAPSLDDLKRAKLEEINADAVDAIQAIAAGYPQFEIDTWQDQEAEARAWLADNSAPTPTLAPIAAARGITLADLCARVIAKAEAYRPAVAAVIGRRQALEDAITAATTAAAVQAIAWPMG